MRLLCARQSELLGSSPIDVCMCVTSGKVQVIDEVFLRVFHSSVQMHHASLHLMDVDCCTFNRVSLQLMPVLTRVCV